VATDRQLPGHGVDGGWTGCRGARDQELVRTAEACDKELESQQQWLMTRMRAAAPQALLVAD
jgi:hypothetical protein